MLTMVSNAATMVDFEPPAITGGAALQHRPWISQSHLSRSLAGVECFLSNSGFARAPWLTVAFGTGIIAWFSLAQAEVWAGVCVVCVLIAVFSRSRQNELSRFPYIGRAIFALSLMVLAGCLTIWTRSEIIGQAAISRPVAGLFTARVLEREEQPALERVRLVLALRYPESRRAIKVRMNVPASWVGDRVTSGTLIRFRGRLSPPASAMFPGGYDFARSAWFSGFSATGRINSPIEVLAQGAGGDWIARQRLALSKHINRQLPGSAGGIAAALTTGDMGAIGKDDAQAMRDAGLAHLLSISGLHVSAAIGCIYFLVLRSLALFPAIALRVRLPILAAVMGALAGIGYTLLSGSQVPTVRSCLSALLVLAALALGRQALSMRLLAAAAFLVLLIWPESVIGPSFQMSFAAVMVLVALSDSAPIKQWLAPRDEAISAKTLRSFALMLVMGIAIEAALMPIGMYHFHRAGLYGAFANLLAIPLTTLVVMPLVALALALDVVGFGAPIWWLAHHAVDALLEIARWVAAQPGAVKVMPRMGEWHFMLFVVGGLWLCLVQSSARLWGLAAIAAGYLGLMMIQAPDVMISGDGRHVAWIDPASERVVTLRDSSSDYALDNIMEAAGALDAPELMRSTSQPKCNEDFCKVALKDGYSTRHLLIARGNLPVPEDALAEACARSDIVIAHRRLPTTCRPKWLKIDRRMLDRTGGITIDLKNRRLTSVAETQGDHGWWRNGVLQHVQR
jgi:competence protein ComEC